MCIEFWLAMMFVSIITGIFMGKHWDYFTSEE